MSKRYTTKTIIDRFNHKNTHNFDYSRVVYRGMDSPVVVICKIHGEIKLTPSQLLRNVGCPICIHNKLISIKTDKEDFVQKSNEVHHNKYDYSKVDYKGVSNKVCIVCPIHGEFWQAPSSHLQGCGCPKCAFEHNNDSTRLTTEEFIRRSIELHGNKYDYSKVKYESSKEKVTIICPIHGDFEQAPIKHLKGQGCPMCGNTKKMTRQEFINKARIVHNDGNYDYSKVDYINNRVKVCIVCPTHGEFWQTPHNHLKGQGCPKCSNKISDGEGEIADFIKKTINCDILTNYRKILNDNKELDIYIPSRNIAFEYDGMIWHSEKFGKDRNYHLNKTEECAEKDVKLYHIYEYEWINKQYIVKNKIEHLLESSNKEKIYARKCKIMEITPNSAEEFLNKNNIEGYKQSTIFIGAFYNDELMSVMSLLSNSDCKWELTRFASDIQYNVIGTAGKIFKWFIKRYNPQEISAFTDRRWTDDSSNNLYTKIGFKFDCVLPPDYRYTKGQNDFIDKSIFTKSYLLSKYGDRYGLTDSMTITEMANKAGFYRIYDCGKFKFIWNNSES